MNLSTTLGFLFFLFLSFFVNAQTNTGYQGLKNLEVENTDTNNILFFCRKSNDDGSSKALQFPWLKSTLLTTTNDTFAIIARFNSKREEIEMLFHDEVYVLFQQKVQAIFIEEKIFITAEYPERDQLFLSYFELISEGAPSLLLKDATTYYYKIDEQPAQKLHRSKKAIFQLFKSDKQALDKYVTANKINFKNTENIIQIFKFMNAIQK